MDASLSVLAKQYQERYGEEVRLKEALRQLYDRYVKERESSILEAVAATAAINAYFFSDQVNANMVTPQMAEAFRLAFPHSSLDQLNGLSPEAAEGWLRAWKGKFFEVIVRDELNAGEQVGDIQLEQGQIAKLAESPSQPGWDLQIFNADGTVAEEYQLKATDSLSYARRAIEENPDISVIATDEGAERVADDLILNSGIKDADLEGQVAAPMEDMLDSPIEEFIEAALPGFPFVLIATAQGAKVLMGRQTLQQALNRSLECGFKTGVAISVGALVSLAGAGIVSLPTTFFTRVGIDRYRVHGGLQARVHADTESIRALLPSTAEKREVAL
jgi:hypothetical protein